MIDLDGSYEEGGGQILRTALGLSMLTQKPFRIHSIRKNRPKPGLKNQHLAAIEILKMISDSRCDAKIGQTELEFHPGRFKAFDFVYDISTAGSITLLLQALLPSMMFSGEFHFRLKGGTDTLWSPQIDYLTNVILPILRKYAHIEITLEKRGYYPKGGGEVQVNIIPRFHIKDHDSFISSIRKKPLILDKTGPLEKIRGIAHASSDLSKAKVAQRMATSAEKALADMHQKIEIATQYLETSSTGCGITLWAEFDSGAVLGIDRLGEKGVKAEDIGGAAALDLSKLIKAGSPVDKHLADNLIPYLALATGKIKVSEISGHTKTNMHIVSRFIDCRFDTDENMIRST